MAKKRRFYLTAKKVLSDKEFKQLQEERSREKARKLRLELQKLRGQRNERSSVLRKVVETSRQPGGFTRALYRKGVTPSGGVATGKRGRPKGTVKYRDPRTGQPIGVYEYRKLLNAQLRERRLQAERNSQLSPQEQRVLADVRARQRAEQLNPERRTIPSTSGNVFLGDIMEDINRATNLVD